MQIRSIHPTLAGGLFFCVLVLGACTVAPSTLRSELPGERPTPPAEYARMTNPLAGDSSASEAGRGIYNANCASCHGEKGLGDGPAAGSLNPRPSPLGQEADLSDAYLYWRIAEGGARQPFQSAMPSWKTFFSQDQIWQVISYLRILMGN